MQPEAGSPQLVPPVFLAELRGKAARMRRPSHTDQPHRILLEIDTERGTIRDERGRLVKSVESLSRFPLSERRRLAKKIGVAAPVVNKMLSEALETAAKSAPMLFSTPLRELQALESEFGKATRGRQKATAARKEVAKETLHLIQQDLEALRKAGKHFERKEDLYKSLAYTVGLHVRTIKRYRSQLDIPQGLFTSK